MKNYTSIVMLVFGLSWAGAWVQQSPLVSSPPVRVGAIRFEEIRFSRDAGQCQSGPCMTASIDYLRVISAENGQIAAKLTSGIADWVLRMDKGNVAKNPEEWLQWWVDREWKVRQEVSEPADALPWEDTTTLRVERQSAQVLTLSCLGYGYHGGAHGSEGLSYANFRPATGERIRLRDIFKEGFAAPLNAVGEQRFRELKGLSPQASLKEAGYYLPDDRFQLNENFAIGVDGLTFYLGEIGPSHADGPTVLLLTYADLQDLLRPHAGIP